MHRAPESLVRLLAATDSGDRDRAWRTFLEEHSRLIHLACRKSSRDYDGTMDRYTYVLERLREDDLRRLRGWRDGGRSKFTTWLVVVASRLCIDWHRSRYGRRSGDEDRARRRRLVDLVGEDVGLDELPGRRADGPELSLRKMELSRALEAALDGLAGEDRLLLRLRYEDGRTAKETARSLGLSSEFVVHRRTRAILDRLRRTLTSEGIRDPRP